MFHLDLVQDRGRSGHWFATSASPRTSVKKPRYATLLLCSRRSVVSLPLGRMPPRLQLLLSTTGRVRIEHQAMRPSRGSSLTRSSQTRRFRCCVYLCGLLVEKHRSEIRPRRCVTFREARNITHMQCTTPSF